MHQARVGGRAALLAPGDDDKMAHFCQLRTERLRSSVPPLTAALHTTAVWGPSATVLQTAAGWAGDCRHQDTAWRLVTETLGNHLHFRHKEL